MVTGGTKPRDAGAVAIAAAVAALAGYLVLLIAARTLSPAQNAEFLAFWGLLFFCFGTLGGLQSEVTRAVHAARTARDPAGPSTWVLPVGLALGGAIALAVAATSWLWGRAALGSDATLLTGFVAFGVVAFSGHAAVAGTLAGLGRWGTHAALVAAESTTRLALAAVVAAGGAALVVPAVGLPAAAALAAATWLVASALPPVGSAWRVRVPGTASAAARRMAHAMTGTAASAALLVGFPVLLRLTSAPDQYALAAPLLLALQLTRAPLMIPLGAFQGMVITHLLDRQAERARPLLRIAALLAGAGAAAAVLAAGAGPWLMVALFGEAYAVRAGTLAALAGAAVLLALLTLTGAAMLALGRHRGYAIGWVVATVTCAGVLLTPLDLEARTLLGLVVGPLAGTLVHAWWITRALRADSPSGR